MRSSRPMPRRDLDHVGAGLLADVGDLVDERDLRGQERVGGELDHLGALDVRAHDRRVERRVELGHRVAGPVAVVADDDAVGLEEVLDRRALLEELGAGDVAEALLALLAERALDVVAGAARHGRLHDQRVAVGRGHRVDDGVDGREVGVARVGRRRADGDEQQARVLERVREVRGEVQAVAVARDEVLEARLPDRDPALLEALDLLRVDVDAVDVGAQLREARRGDEADVPRADHADRLPCVRAHWTDHPSERGDGYFWPSRFSEAAMPIICRVLSDWVSVFETQ